MSDIGAMTWALLSWRVSYLPVSELAKLDHAVRGLLDADRAFADACRTAMFKIGSGST